MKGPGRQLRVLAWPADGNRTGNPYNAMLAQALRELGAQVDEFTPARLARGGYDIFHAHWPDGALTGRGTLRAAVGAAALLALTAAARLRATRVVWTVHNLASHGDVPLTLERVFWSNWTRLVDGSIHLGEAARAAAMDAFPRLRRRPSYVVPHPHYRQAYPPVLERRAARGALGIDPDLRLLAMVGHLRRYKMAAQLVEAFRAVPDPGARLLVAGRPESDDLAHEIRRAAAGDSRIDLRLSEVSAGDMPSVLGAADLVALPYADLLNSGVALLALSMDRPVLAPKSGAMTDLREATGTDWVHLYSGPLTADVIAQALDRASNRPPQGSAPLDAFAPSAVAEATLQAYRSLVAGRRRG